MFEIDKINTVGYLFGYFVIAKTIVIAIQGYIYRNFIYLLLDINMGLLSAILYGALIYKIKNSFFRRNESLEEMKGGKIKNE